MYYCFFINSVVLIISLFLFYLNFLDLHAIGGLVPLLGYLKNPHPNIRAKAAEVVNTIVQNNPKSQQLVMEANGMEPLLYNFTSDPDVTVRTKALGAISCVCLRIFPFFICVVLFYIMKKGWIVKDHF